MIQFPQFVRKANTSSGDEYLDINTKFLFHHIPKTAGSTLRGILESMFEIDEICPAETVEELSALSQKEFDKYRLYAGHFSYGSISSFLPDAIWVTFLREPNERVISQYYNHINDDRIPAEWLRRVEKNSVWKEYMDAISGCTLEEWITLPNKRANSITCNRQTQAFLPQNLRVAVEDWSVHDDKLLSIAKKNLEKNFTFFGIQEYFDLSFTLFSATFGLAPLADTSGYTTNTNMDKKFGKRYDVGEKITNLITERNSMDWELYRFGEQLFLSRVRDMFSDFILRDRGGRLESWLNQDEEQISKAGTSEWKIEDVLGMKGLYTSERTRLGQKFRWTGADAVTTIELNKTLEKNELYQIKIKALSCIDNSVLDTLEVSFDGESADSPVAKNGWIGSGVIISFDVKVSSSSMYHILEIMTGRQSEDPTRKDARLLGLAIHSIEIKKR